MASSSHSEPAKTEQIITEFFAKSLRIILESRSPCVSSSRNYSGEQVVSSPSPSSSSSSSSRDKWFNLALRECPASLENLDFWRKSNSEPMVVDVLLVKKPGDFNVKEQFPSSWNSREEFMMDMKSEKIIERWIVQYESGKKSEDTNKTSKRGGVNTSQSLYKKSIILLRSLYLTVRLLPAYNLYRDLNSSGKIHTYSLAHRVSSFVDPFTRVEEGELRQFVFTPVETSCGRLRVSVLYCPTLSDVNSEPSPPISPQFIPDYVGSPTTNPLKRFPSLPRTGLDTPGSPSAGHFARRHSWSNDAFRNFPPSVSPSLVPSPAYSDSRALPSKLNSQLMSSPGHPPENAHSHNSSLAHKNTSFDECCPSPIFSPSPSPSPPTHITDNQLPKAIWRTESAPVSIPAVRISKTPSLPSNQIPPLSPSPRATKQNTSFQTDNARALTKLGEISTGITNQKVSPFGKDEFANISGARLSSHSSPRVSFSRSSARFSFQDEFDDSDFCPFAFDDFDAMDTRIRTGSSDGKGHLSGPLDLGRLLSIRASQDAAVGSLVRILKTATPLRQDFSNSKLSQVPKPEIVSKSIQEPDENTNPKEGAVQNPAFEFGTTASGLLLLRTTSEALEELQVYKDMKEKLLKQGSEYQTMADVSRVATETIDKDTG